MAREIISTLLHSRNAERAIKITIERNESAYSFYKYIRQKILRNDDNRCPNYLQRLRHFQYLHFSPQDEEWKLLENLYHSPLSYQYRVETSRKAYLPATPDLDKALKQIKCLPESFYEYRMPEDVVARAVEQEREKRELKHMEAVTISDLQTILSKAQSWRDVTHPWERVACASILCGRRVMEIIDTLTWEKEGPYLARVRGITKQDILDESVVIPLLCTYEDFDELMQLIREAHLPTDCTTHRLKPAFNRYFGQWYNHSQRRNIYGEATFRLRHQSGFFPSMSKIAWIDKALCHNSNVIQQASNLTYQALVFEDERDD